MVQIVNLKKNTDRNNIVLLNFIQKQWRLMVDKYSWRIKIKNRLYGIDFVTVFETKNLLIFYETAVKVFILKSLTFLLSGQFLAPSQINFRWATKA